MSEKLTKTVLGLLGLHGAPPPVQAEAGIVTTVVAEPVAAVIGPEQFVPRSAPVQVYVREPEAAEGPPAGEKSVVTCKVTVPLPDEDVLAL